MPTKKASARKAKSKRRASRTATSTASNPASATSLSSLRPERRVSRDALIDAAIELIHAHGVDALRIEDVCERVGVSKGSMYWHFGDREGLIREALLEHMYRLGDEQLTVLNSAVDKFTTRDDYLMRIAGAFVDPFDKSQVESRWQRLELIAGSRRDPKLAPIMAEIQRRHHRYLSDIMERAAREGLLRPDVDPKAIAALLVVVGLGSNVLSLLGDEGPQPEAWTASLLVLVDALFPPK